LYRGVFFQPGNHEYRRDSLRNLVLDPHWKVQFNLPKNGPEGLQDAVYYLDYQDMRLISLNSQLIMLDSLSAIAQEEWLDKVLAASTKKWNVVVMHHPVFSTAKNRDNTILRERFKPIFEKYGVRVVNQERVTYLLIHVIMILPLIKRLKSFCILFLRRNKEKK